MMAQWRAAARPDQLTPVGEWLVWLIQAGRGWGKTRTGAQDAAIFGLANPGSRLAVVAPTYSDARDTCVEGDSGLLGILPQVCVRAWNRSLGELILVNDTRYKLFSADEPERLRGPQHHRAWADEVGAWRYPETWDQLLFGLRLGRSPRVVATTTPRPTKLIRSLVDSPTTIITRGSTFDNAANLAASTLASLKARYEGTRLGRQELAGELLGDTPGALWTLERIDELRIDFLPKLRRIVVAIDPAVTSGEDADESGIIVAGIGMENPPHGYVLEDCSIRGTPDEVCRRAVRAYHQWGADRVVAEANNGGDWIESLLRTADPDISFRKVTASRGKVTRAEPCSSLYEQGRFHHCGTFPALEDQQTAFTTDFDAKKAGYSPDRVDGLVWAQTELFGGTGMSFSTL